MPDNSLRLFFQTSCTMKHLFFPFFLLFSLSLNAQYYEIGAYLGTANYAGELSEHRLSQEGFKGMIGVFGRMNATNRLSLKASLSKATLEGADRFARKAELRERNLSFRTDVVEMALTGEVNFTPYNIRANKTGVPYFFTGIALGFFNPQAEMRGSWYDLQPLQTEGKKYSRCTVAVPFGLGMKFNISYKLNIGLEFGARKTFSDYLDDVSTNYPDIYELRRTEPTSASLSYRTPELTGELGTNPVGLARGESNNKDWYFFGGVTISVNLTDKYGLDFDKKYEPFKEHLKKKKEEKEKVSKPKKPAKSQKKWRLFKKRQMIEPTVKKRTN